MTNTKSKKRKKYCCYTRVDVASITNVQQADGARMAQMAQKILQHDTVNVK
jgi:hypothetical protein